jgi:hypothetical protein
MKVRIRGASWRPVRSVALAVIVATMAVLPPLSRSASALPSPSVPSATVSLPPQVNQMVDPGLYPVPAGYTNDEFFVSGRATYYTPSAPLSANGQWSVATSTASAPYTVRIVVRAPSDPRRFNGSVVVEWMNVSGGHDLAVDWNMTHEELVRTGTAYVGVSAQWVGVASPSGGLKSVDPARYASLQHPGDAYSYDIFSQVGAAIVRPQGLAPLGNLTPSHLIAAGESQSASRLVTYIDSVQPNDHVYDGFLVHSRGSGGANLSQTLNAGAGTGNAVNNPPLNPVPSVVSIRTDTGVPVFVVEMETDVIILNEIAARQADAPNFRLWEIAGTAHADTYLAGLGPRVLSSLSCGATVYANSGPGTWALRAAVRHLEAWIDHGTLPPSGTLITTSGNAIQRDPVTGIALGGIRLPDVVVPIATLSGERPAGNGPGFCAVFGFTDPWNGGADPWDVAGGPGPAVEPNLDVLYPNHGSYVQQFTQATDASIKDGFLLKDDRDDFVGYAVHSSVGH